MAEIDKRRPAPSWKWPRSTHQRTTWQPALDSVDMLTTGMVTRPCHGLPARARSVRFELSIHGVPAQLTMVFVIPADQPRRRAGGRERQRRLPLTGSTPRQLDAADGTTPRILRKGNDQRTRQPPCPKTKPRCQVFCLDPREHRSSSNQGHPRLFSSFQGVRGSHCGTFLFVFTSKRFGFCNRQSVHAQQPRLTPSSTHRIILRPRHIRRRSKRTPKRRHRRRDAHRTESRPD